MNIIREYLRLAVFAMGLLSGVQIPAFIDQYQKRVDAHLLEARQNLAGFKQTAERYFEGDMTALIHHYRSSPDAVFQQDAKNVQLIYERTTLLQNQWDNLNSGVVERAYYVARHYNPQLLQETINQYSYTVPLEPVALGWGICIALLFAAVFDIFIGLSAKTCSVCYHAARNKAKLNH
ncbi:MAG: hypothetical protein CL578_06650 [Alteromonadaceae bacterium]|uniref:DUF2937 family protein n=1 Tax=Paraglaciecola chathamensis TaxID=368405 RepID=UPI000C697A09|nr:DUF2937 family protein [Paraglaciecola agarilytica]MBN24712.1 hypothetical protein [Alteromonadaceae bacterium]|tara:strand:+ start:522 stop:1055 length:534 start_codon:yes stop_codon:yes gene_type:complete